MKLTLAEAIRRGAQDAPQGFEEFFTGKGRTFAACALGAACIAIREIPYSREAELDSIAALYSTFPELEQIRVTCPACDYDQIPFPALEDIIPHLNDDHRWTREAIADWVESLTVQIPAVVAQEVA